MLGSLEGADQWIRQLVDGRGARRRASGHSAVLSRLNLYEISRALLEVEREWPRIDAELQRLRIGRKDPFTAVLRRNMLSAYAYLDEWLANNIAPFRRRASTTCWRSTSTSTPTRIRR